MNEDARSVILLLSAVFMVENLLVVDGSEEEEDWGRGWDKVGVRGGLNNLESFSWDQNAQEAKKVLNMARARVMR